VLEEQTCSEEASTRDFVPRNWKELPMNTGLFSIVLASQLGNPLMTPIGDRVPTFNVEATCKASVATDKAMNLANPQSYESCMRDETTAQQQLAAGWSSSPGSIRDSCEQEAVAGGSASYVDLLTCLQMATDWAKASSPTPILRGASKKRNQN
jgi:hypothetical protein